MKEEFTKILFVLKSPIQIKIKYQNMEEVDNKENYDALNYFHEDNT